MHPKQIERSQRRYTQFTNMVHIMSINWFEGNPIPIHFCQHLLNLDCDEYEFCHQTDKVVCNTCTVRMQGCRMHGAVPYAKCRISLATTVHEIGLGKDSAPQFKTGGGGGVPHQTVAYAEICSPPCRHRTSETLGPQSVARPELNG